MVNFTLSPKWPNLLHRALFLKTVLMKCFFNSNNNNNIIINFLLVFVIPLTPHSAKPFHFSLPLEWCLFTLWSFSCSPLSVWLADCFHLPTDMITTWWWLTHDGLLCWWQHCCWCWWRCCSSRYTTLFLLGRRTLNTIDLKAADALSYNTCI